MVHPIDPILREALGLSEQDRAILVRRLIASFDSEVETDEQVEQAWGQEIAQRLSRLDAGEMKKVPGDRVRLEARGMLDGRLDG
ncbi:MAG: addiction module protein [Phycisphaerales bacterium JB063]